MNTTDETAISNLTRADAEQLLATMPDSAKGSPRHQALIARLERDEPNTIITVEDAAEHLVRVWATIPPEDLATALNCIEVDALCVLFRTLGHHDVADTWTEAHAVSDDEDDEHTIEPTSAWPPAGWQFLLDEHDNDIVRVIDPEGQARRVHIEDADPEHRFQAIRHAATWFATRPTT